MTTQQYLNNRRARQRGLTLIELVVVLAILVALAGLIVANFPGVITRAHTATCATHVADVNKIMQYSYTTTLAYPSGFDSLLDSGTDTLFDKLPGHAVGTPVGNWLTASTLNAGEALALAQIGITNTFNLNPNASDATWSATDLTSQNSFLSGTPNVALIQTTYATNVWPNLAQTLTNYVSTKFVVFGVGSGCTAVGPGHLMQEAPTHFGDNANMNPQNNYQRIAVVFRVDTDPSTNVVASFVGAGAIHDDSIGTSEGDIHDYYQIAQ